MEGRAGGCRSGVADWSATSADHRLHSQLLHFQSSALLVQRAGKAAEDGPNTWIPAQAPGSGLAHACYSFHLGHEAVNGRCLFVTLLSNK